MPSAPASTYANALTSASSNPFSKIRLSIRAIIIKSFVRCARFPALIFAVKFSILSCVCSTSVPNKEFFLSPVLSSIITAETPTRSNVLTLYTKCSIIPPVSPSNMIGFVVTSNTSSTVRSLEDMSTSSISGFPFAVESHRLDNHIASNWSISPLLATTVFSAINPVRPLCTSSVFTIGHNCNNCRNRFLRYSGIAVLSRITASIFLTCSLYVYGISINWPPHFFRFSMTLSRITSIGSFSQLSPCIT